ncbi:MAG: hypothetical protein JJ864_10600 [Rhizobiaceae bacterium]|nr:hypothetical protein [Rhizobiaceae bacterium]
MDKTHLKQTMLSLTEAELSQAARKYQQFLGTARLDRSEPIENDEQAQAETASILAEAFDDQVHGYQDKIARLHTIDFGPRTEVTEGAVVSLGDRHLVIAVSTAQFDCDGRTFVGISTAAPIFAAIEGKTAGDTCTFRGRALVIDNIY